MSVHKREVTLLARLLSVLVGMSMLSSCFGKSTYRWKEEVQLYDGRVIVIKRSVRTGEVPVELGQPPGESDYTLTFKTSDGKSVTWEAGKSFRPMILDFSGGVPYVVATGMTGPVYERHGCPRPPYFFFRYADGAWQQINYNDFPRPIRNRNLASGVTYRKETVSAVNSGLVTREDVRKSQLGLDNFYKEVREDAPNPCAHRGNDYKYIQPK